MEILGFLLGMALGGVGGYLIYRFKSNNELLQKDAGVEIIKAKNTHLEVEVRRLFNELTEERNKCFKVNTEFSKSQVKLENLQERLDFQKVEMLELQTRFTKEFENLATKILEEKTEKFTQLNRSNLDEILKPLGEKIKDFEKKIEENTKENVERHTSLKEQIFHLNQLNQQISKEANNLASALKGQVKVQGKWGEIILESILEKSGLAKDREYFVQNVIGNSRPDIIIHLPDNKKIVVDAKVSLTAYDRFCCEEDELVKAKILREHIASVKGHVKSLGEKSYQNLFDLGGIDFVLLFIPIEPAFNLAVMHDINLFNEAFDKNIVIVSTSTLLATLRTIASIWRQENQTKNVLEIAQQSGALYDKFVGFLEDMEDVGRKVISLQGSYDKALNKLSSGKDNLITRADKIKKLGARTTKSIPVHFTNNESSIEGI